MMTGSSSTLNRRLKALLNNNTSILLLAALLLIDLLAQPTAAQFELGDTLADLASGGLQEGASLLNEARGHAAEAWGLGMDHGKQLFQDARSLAAERAQLVQEQLGRLTDARAEARGMIAQGQNVRAVFPPCFILGAGRGWVD